MHTHTQVFKNILSHVSIHWERDGGIKSALVHGHNVSGHKNECVPLYTQVKKEINAMLHVCDIIFLIVKNGIIIFDLFSW